MQVKAAMTPTNRRSWLAAAACTVLAWPAVASYEQRRPWPRGRGTPSLELPALDGEVWTLAAARGHPVLLNFWASWCEPCRAEMPSLQQLAARHEAEGLQVVAINFREGERAVRRFIAATGLRLPVLYDRDGAAAKSLDVHTFPSTVAIGRDGKAKFVVRGEVDWSSPSVQRWVEALLQRTGVRAARAATRGTTGSPPLRWPL
jgi:thiol-disulfide isomerase/thioredoxin